MNISVRGKQMEVTDALKEYVLKRVGKLEKYSDEFMDVKVTLLVEEGRHRVEVTAPIHGIILRGEEESTDMYASIDMVVEKLERQIDKYRTRINKRMRTKVLKDHETLQPANLEDDSEEVVRYKRFGTKPMSVEEAIMQMNLVGHNFYAFTNMDTHAINVVYRRKSGGDYGLLEPEK
ncbi:ribosome-associated protein Y (PSrp-1) [Desulfitobacterium dichloroeliminans LMG P-21439]|uniref:Ribosome hibernation promoting factor n=1 Tax=Desulfitobacterium dichloroeliminans (strain LMG P-21439 / DCA1) TaxID=871963 RepID=L0FC41_DESDL|nr:ribosome-associated translation inhibitor RaiA [Desulfitobacterium dichloroeliminans]AGA70792.1 ribosome-associated protein Y (PSrp-1) [Desulfitobacterium dichloroeliminans LMG P-21439]